MTYDLAFENNLTLRLEIAPPCERESFFVFGMPRSGSTMLTHVMLQLCKRLNVPIISIPDIAYSQGVPRAAYEDSSELERVLFPTGYCYQSFRHFAPFLRPFFQAQPRLSILMIRDPRDILTSLYFSIAYSHRIPVGEMGATRSSARDAAQQANIDDFVIEHANSVRKLYQSYEILFAGERTKLFRYEDIIFSKAEWIRNMLDFLGESIPERVIGNIADRMNTIPESENVYEHVRRVTPGDYKEKLRPETIARLNEQFAGVLGRFGYAVD